MKGQYKTLIQITMKKGHNKITKTKMKKVKVQNICKIVYK